jgi:RNA polymerase sigma-70 factor (ECF subfamily)
MCLKVLSKMSMWPDAENTQELLAGARAGRQEAVDQLLERHRAALRRIIEMRIDPQLERRVDASDIVQEVMIEASRRLPGYLEGNPLPFHLWLRQMAKDRLIDAHRRHRLAARRSVDREQPLAGRPRRDVSTQNLAAQVRDKQMTPASAATWRELERRFAAACAELEEQDEEIVLMRHFEQLSNSEAAIALGLTPQAASMRYLRAMRRLRELLHIDEA